jgi:hypothetical protein
MTTIPPGGFHFPLENAPTLEASSFEELQAQLLKFRVDNNLPVGDPRKDIQEYVLTNYPAYASSVSAEAPKVDEDALAKNQRERVSVWASNRYAMRAGGHTELEPRQVAEDRAAVCESCPHNQPFVDDCHSCVEHLSRTLFLLRQGGTTGNAGKLFACDITGQDNLTAAYLPEKMLAHRKKFASELPDYCWLTKLDHENTTTV